MHWYKRDCDAALTGMAALTLEERGAYNGVLDMLYSRDGDLPNDDELIACTLRVNPRTWRKMRDALIRKGKLWLVSGSKIMAKRVERELKESRKVSQTQSNRAAKRWERGESGNVIKLGSMRGGNASTTTSTTTTTSTKKKEGRISKASESDWPADYIDQFWSQYPRRVEKRRTADLLGKLRKQGLVSWDTLMAGVMRYAAAMSGSEMRFIKQPPTWLNAGCWDDDAKGYANGRPEKQSPGDRARELAAEVRLAEDQRGIVRSSDALGGDRGGGTHH